MTKHEFNLPGTGEITSVVMSEEEFKEFCDNLEKSMLGNIKIDSDNIKQVRQMKAQIEIVRRNQYVFGVQRNPATEALFLETGVRTNVMAVCLRGIARQTLGLGGTVTITQSEAQRLLNEHYLGLTPDQKQDVDQAVVAMMACLREEGLPAERCGKITNHFLAKYMGKLPRGMRLEYLSQMQGSMVQTLTLRMMEFEDPYAQDFDGYLRRLFTGAIVTGDIAFKALKN